jgi:HlyD family secretion protein
MKPNCSWQAPNINSPQEINLKSKNTMKSIFKLLGIAILFASCNNGEDAFDASGTFEAEEVIVSSEVTGAIQQLDADEGQNVEAGQALGWIDSTQLYLKKKQLQAQIKAVLSKRPHIATQLASFQEQLSAAEREQQRVLNLFKAEAATQKQLDDINAQVDLIKRQIEAHRSSLDITSQGLISETLPLTVQIEQLEDQLQKSRIINPIPGTVLAKYAEAHELVTPGKPLYKVADIRELDLRAYVTGTQLPVLKLNQKVKVLVDDGNGSYKEHEGIITWISSKAEFTPKTIQTKEERADLVYATKVHVKNDGSIKIGMYGEVKF